ncbi:MAG: hypothetical protein V4646_11430 [Pseudomonadota bacterium]
MLAHDHDTYASRIENSLGKCGPDDHELQIEGAMLAAAHRINAHFHRLGISPPEDDIVHTYLLTINEHRRLCLVDQEAMVALGAIEDLRPAFVRGDHPGGAEAAQRAASLLATVRNRTSSS